jgi:enoyl-CoA hydratase
MRRSMSESFQTIAVEVLGHNLEKVVLDRPQSANALNTQMGRDLLSYFEALALEPDRARCVVLTGRGDKAFCAGGDLKERNGMSTAKWRAQHLVFERMARAILFCPTPIVAAVNGVAFGGGCEIAALCDFIYASDRARFAMTETSLGIIPGAGGTQTLARVLGERRAKELIFTARSFSAQEAVEWGLVNAIHPHEALEAEALRAAKTIAAAAPIAVRQAKQAIARGLQMSISDGMAFEIEAYNRLVSTEDRVEGIKAFNEKRQPAFRGA